MKRVLVQYKLKPDKVEENERYVREVFEELKREGTEGIRYATFKKEDGVSFVHIASIEAEENPLPKTAAFQRFQENIRDRCEEPPVAVSLDEIGSYRLFGN
jgi:L-rhamnose mutarotase